MDDKVSSQKFNWNDLRSGSKIRITIEADVIGLSHDELYFNAGGGSRKLCPDRDNVKIEWLKGPPEMFGGILDNPSPTKEDLSNGQEEDADGVDGVQQLQQQGGTGKPDSGVENQKRNKGKGRAGSARH